MNFCRPEVNRITSHQEFAQSITYPENLEPRGKNEHPHARKIIVPVVPLAEKNVFIEIKEIPSLEKKVRGLVHVKRRLYIVNKKQFNYQVGENCGQPKDVSVKKINNRFS